MKVLSLFSGIGAFEKALENLKIDYELVGFSEIDKFAIQSYCAIHSTTPDKNLGDISKIDLDNLPKCDLITHGSPCQDFSVAGKGKGGDVGTETRSSLMWNSVEIIRRCKPKYVIWENVKNVLSKKHRHNFDKYIESLEEIGYKNYYKVLNAKDYGVPQNRERIFVISIRSDIEQDFEFPQPFDNGIRLKDILESEVDEKFYISTEKVEKLLMQLKDKEISNTVRASGRGSVDRHSWDMVCAGNVNPSGKGMNGNVYAGEIAPTLTTNKGEGQKICIPCLTPDRIEKRQNGRRFKEDGDPSFTLTSQDRHGVLQVGNIVETGNWDNPQRGRIYSSEGCSPSLNTVGGGGLEPKVLIKQATKQGYIECEIGGVADLSFPNSKTRRGRVQENGTISPTITATETGICRVELDYRIRKLTPKECFRLMGFDDASFQKCVDIGISNSQLYKQAGNSIVVNVLECVFRRLFGVNEDENS